MSMNSCVVGFGPFSEGICHLLDYDRAVYRDIKSGDLVFSQISEEMVTRQGSRELANALGIDINSGQWQVLLNLVSYSEGMPDTDTLMQFNYPEVPKICQDCITLLKKDWTLFFVPNM